MFGLNRNEYQIKSLGVFLSIGEGSEYRLLLPATKVLINSSDTIGSRTIPILLSRDHMANCDSTFHWQKLFNGHCYRSWPFVKKKKKFHIASKNRLAKGQNQNFLRNENPR